MSAVSAVLLGNGALKCIPGIFGIPLNKAWSAMWELGVVSACCGVWSDTLIFCGNCDPYCVFFAVCVVAL